MTTSPIHHVKIGSNPTSGCWSQSYAAGTLFAVVSLSSNQEETAASLGTIGKELINTLEEEYFTLETKELSSIRNAAEATINKIPQDLNGSVGIVAIVKDIMYGFVFSSSLISINRGNTTKTLLSGSTNTPLEAISGHMKHGDRFIIATKSFQYIMPLEKFFANKSLEESLEEASPLLHEKEDGTACAVAIAWEGQQIAVEDELESPAPDTDTVPVKQQEQDSLQSESFDEFPPSSPRAFPLRLPHVSLPSSFSLLHLSHAKKLFLSIAFILVIALIASIYFSQKQQENAKIKALFDATYAQAEQKYEEGKSLAELNTNLSRQNLTQAQKILKQAQASFSKGSKEEQKTKMLLEKVETLLAEVSGVSSVSAVKVDMSTSSLLQAIVKTKGADAATQTGNSVFVLTKNSIVNDAGKKLIENDDYWQNAVGIGSYLINLYVLDTSGSIVKLVPSGSSYVKQDYLTTKEDLSSATAITLDTAVWILYKDGTIKKFLRGKPETFFVINLDTPLNDPIKIFTSVDTKNLYILDRGNGRIVALDKNGSYQAQYKSALLKKASHFDVNEKAKQIIILADKKAYQLDIK